MDQKSGFTCVFDVTGLVAILGFIHSIRYHHSVHKLRYDPFSCVLGTRESPFYTVAKSINVVSMTLLSKCYYKAYHRQIMVTPKLFAYIKM